LVVGTDLSPSPSIGRSVGMSLSVCLSVCPEGALWQMDAVWGGEWGRSRMGVLDGSEIVEGEGAVLVVNVGLSRRARCLSIR